MCVCVCVCVCETSIMHVVATVYIVARNHFLFDDLHYNIYTSYRSLCTHGTALLDLTLCTNEDEET